MSISSSEKVFIDPREEITFVVERLLKSEKDRVILVVPLNSLLLSSLVSIDILFRKLVRTKKLAIIVTEDEYGKAIAFKAGFVVVDKVSQITADQWSLANNKKLSVKEVLDERKKLLLENISGESKITEPLPEIPGTEDDTFEITAEQIGETIQESSEDIETETTQPEPEIETPESILNEVPLDDIQSILPQKSQDEIELEKSLKKYSKPRREVKEIEIDGIKIVSGGDIKGYIDSKENVKITDNDSFTKMSEEINIDRKIKKVGSSSFTGKDFTKKVNDKGALSNFLSRFSLRKRNSSIRDENDFIKKKNRKKRLLVASIVLLLVLLGGFYVSAFQISTVDVTLTLRAQDVSTSATFVMSKSAEELSLESPITIPAKEFSIAAESLSISKTGTADGAAKRGVKAKGLVTIYSLKTESITLKAGTKLKNLTNNLIYLSTADVTVPARTTAVDNSFTPGKADISIEAEAFGPQFNITLTPAETTKFSVESYEYPGEMSATAFSSVTGGTSEDFISVSQENFDKLKETIIPDLKKQGLTRLKGLIESGYQLIEGTVTYDESKAPESLPKVGEEAKEKTFNLTVQIGIKGYAVKTEDLTEALSSVLKSNAQGSSSNNLQVDDIGEPQIDKVEASGEDFVVTASSKGSVKTQITPEQMKKDIAGFTLQQANDYFRLIDYIDSYRVSFNPGFVPDGLKRVPTDTSRINIKTK